MSIAQYSNITHQTNTCLKSTAVKLAKGVKYVQSSLQKYNNDVIDIVLVSLLLTLNIFHAFF